MRARSVKPGLLKNEVLGSADPLLSLLFVGLWCLADREGRLEDRPMRIRAEVFAFREKVTTAKVDKMLSWLHDNSFIVRYSIDVSRYIAIKKFKEHQRPHQNEAMSRIPEPPENQIVGSNGAQPRYTSEVHQGYKHFALNPSSLNPHSLTAGELTSDQGQDPPPRQAGSSPRQSELESHPTGDDFSLTPAREKLVVQRLPYVDLPAFVERFRNIAKLQEWKGSELDIRFELFVQESAPNSGHWSAGKYPQVERPRF